MNVQMNLLQSKEGDSVFKNALVHLPGIGRLPGLGTVSFVSVRGSTTAMLLTSSYVANAIRDDPERHKYVFFFEDAIAGMTTRPTKVQLRAHEFLFSSTAENDEPGYGLVRCDQISCNGGRAITAAAPVPLPIFPSRQHPTKVGDVHLLVMHPMDGNERRKTVLAKVDSLAEHHCVYDCSETLGYKQLSTGGLSFNMKGELVGVIHQTETYTVAVLAVDIMRHLFYSHLLYNIEADIVDDDTLREAAEGQQVKSISDSEIWAEWACPPDVTNVTATAFGFMYHERLVTRAIRELVSHHHRRHFPKMAQLGGIEAVIRAMNMYPAYDGLCETCIQALAPFTQFEDNRAAFLEGGGLELLIAAMREHHRVCKLLQWSAKTLSNLVAPDVESFSEDVKRTIMERGVVLLLVQAMTENLEGIDGMYLYKFCSTLFGHLVHNNHFLVADVAIKYNAAPVLMGACTNPHLVDALESILYAFTMFLEEDGAPGGDDVIELLVKYDMFGVVSRCLQEDDSRGLLWEHSLDLVQRMVRSKPAELRTAALAASFDELAVTCTQRQKSNVTLLQAAVRLCVTLERSVDELFADNPLLTQVEY